MTLPVVVLAGGLGTRLAEVTRGRLPKALVDVGGKPFLDRKLDELAAQGVEEVFLLVGHGSELITEHLTRSTMAMPKVTCVEDGEQLLGTGGAIVHALGVLPPAFFVTYGDTLLDQRMEAVEQRFERSGRPVLMTVVRNQDQVQRSNASVEGDLVVSYSKDDPPGSHDHLDYGLLVFARTVFEARRPGQPVDLAEILGPLAASHLVTAMVIDEDFHDVGTPEALAGTSSRFTRERAADAPGRSANGGAGG